MNKLFKAHNTSACCYGVDGYPYLYEGDHKDGNEFVKSQANLTNYVRMYCRTFLKDHQWKEVRINEFYSYPAHTIVVILDGFFAPAIVAGVNRWLVNNGWMSC